MNTFQSVTLMPHKKSTWYTRFYGIDPNSGTPLREALSRVGRYYAGITSGINSSMTDDPMQYSCQQNISILTTDGFWNGNSGDDLNVAILSIIRITVNSGYSTRADGAYDGGLGGSRQEVPLVALIHWLM